MLHRLLTSWHVEGGLRPGLRLWLRLRWLVFILLGLVSVGYAFALVRGAETVNRASFYWFFYSGALLIMGGLVEQGHNLERREAEARPSGRALLRLGPARPPARSGFRPARDSHS